MRFSLVFIAGIVSLGAIIGNVTHYFEIQIIFEEKSVHFLLSQKYSKDRLF